MNNPYVITTHIDKGKTSAEWGAWRKEKSWKTKLKIATNAAIPQARDFDGFLRLPEAQGQKAAPDIFLWAVLFKGYGYLNNGILPVSLLTFFLGPQIATPKYCRELSGAAAIFSINSS